MAAIIHRARWNFNVDEADGISRRYRLLSHLPETLELQVQEHVPIGDRWGLQFEIDLVLYDREDGRPIAVLDTKYKPEDRPATDDIEQIVAYAQAKGCQEAILVYPALLPVRFNEPVGDIRVRSLSFVLGGDLEQNGREFLDSVLKIVNSETERVTTARP